jgi:hypothetical protein
MEYFDANVISQPPNEAGVYKKPLYYGLIHVFSGFVAFYYSWFGIVFLLYQLSQLILNKRYFIFQWKIEEGNSLSHTAFKLSEFLVGLLIGYIIHKSFPKLKFPGDRFSKDK